MKKIFLHNGQRAKDKGQRIFFQDPTCNVQRLLFFVLCLLTVGSIRAQQYPLFTNYIYNGYISNPAIIGTYEHVDVRGTYRSQWNSFDGAPVTSTLAATIPVGKFLTIGGMFVDDLAGRLKKNGGALMLSFNKNLSENLKMNIGASVGYYKFRITDDVFAQSTNDPIIGGGQQGLATPDIALGIYLKQKDGFFGGFSVPQLFNKKLDFDPTVARTSTTQVARHYYGFIGYDYVMNEKMTIEPSFHVKTAPNTNPQYDAGVRAIFNKMFWIGGSYRTEDALTAMVGIDMPKWFLAYSYDMTTSNIRNGSSGSHEISIGVRLFKNACPDKDKDGICDKDDKCPDEPGTKENNGCPEKKTTEKCPDRDKDGICDADDKCPDDPGPKANKGCPFLDRDGDGVRDDLDKCPDIPGTVANEGCPINDRDHDGVPDEVDPCPDVPGPVWNKGCPEDGDRDHDGTPDKLDACPDVPGPKENKGCPITNDKDGDGIPDEYDRCPNTFGTKENNGCPNVSDYEKDLVSLAIKDLYFDTDKFNIRPSAFKNLNTLANLLKAKKDWKIQLNGYADARGNKEHNQMLSKNRCEIVKNYLISKGVSPDLIQTKSHGDLNPIYHSNQTIRLQLQRRVEIEFMFD